MTSRELEKHFILIVQSLLQQDTDPAVLGWYIAKYAKDAGTSYALARQAVIHKAKSILDNRIAQI